jgi:hypothetical protein
MLPCRRAHYVHHLVADAFLGPRPEGKQIRHRDDDSFNNVASNLMYGTPSQNALARERAKREGRAPTRRTFDTQPERRRRNKVAVTKKYTQSIPVQLTQGWRNRVQGVCDAAQVSKAEIIRTCVETCLPSMEVALGIASEETKAALMAQITEGAGLEWTPDEEGGVLDLDALTESAKPETKTMDQLLAEATERAKAAGDRAAGSFGWDPTPWLEQSPPAGAPGV